MRLPRRPKPSTRAGVIVELLITVALAVALAFGVQEAVAKPYRIPSSSMLPTLAVGERVIVDRLLYRLGSDPEIGDIVVFHPPATVDPSYDGAECPVEHPEGSVCPANDAPASEQTFIKRVVAGPGDVLRVEDGIPIVNGEPIEADWSIRPCRGLGGCDFPTEVTIPPDHWFMMGDNRGNSDDSRYWGPVARDRLIGGAALSYWPPNQIGTL